VYQSYLRGGGGGGGFGGGGAWGWGHNAPDHLDAQADTPAVGDRVAATTTVLTPRLAMISMQFTILSPHSEAVEYLGSSEPRPTAPITWAETIPT
jgi:hypothetical protein